MADHKKGYIFVIAFTFIVFLIAVLISYANTNNFLEDLIPGLFETTTEISDKYYLEITPAGWTFTIWAFIYVYQFLWLIYGLSTICRKTNDWQGYLYYKPSFMPISIYVIYIINLMLTISWVFLYDREILVASTPVLFAVSVTLYICIGISYYALNKQGDVLIQNGHRREIGFVRGFVHNGLAMYAAWTTIATLLNLGQTVAYRTDMEQKDVSSIVLGILGFEIIFFVILDNFLIDKFSRFTFTPYFVLIVALAGSIDKNWVMGERNSTITAVLIGLAGFALIFKIVMVIQRSRKEPEPILKKNKF